MNPRQKRLAAKGHVYISLVLVSAGLWSAVGPVMASEPGSLTLIIGLYSGRRDPELNLQNTEAALVLQMLSEVSPAPAQDSQSVFPWSMGYTAVRVDRWGTNNLVESVTVIRGTNILVASGTGESWFHAPDTRLEDYLLNLAYMRGVISAEMYDYIQAVIHPTHRAFLLHITVTTSGSREARLDWSGSPGPYAVQQRASPVADWNLIAATNAMHCTVALTNASGFFRVQRLMPSN